MADNNFIEKVEEKLTVEIILSILKKYEIEPHITKTKKENELWFTTVCHHGDSHKLCFFKDSKRFFCYTNCGSMNLFQLLMKIKNCNFSIALKEVAKEVGLIGFEEGFFEGEGKENIHLTDSQFLWVNTKWIQPEKREVKQRLLDIEKIKIADYEERKNILEYFDNNVFYRGWINEGIKISVMREFGIRWYELEKYIIIPHKDKEGKLIGIRRRSLKPEDSKNKYMPLIMKDGTSYEHALAMNLYGLYENKEAIERYGRVFLVEGEKSVLLSNSFYQEETYDENGKKKIINGSTTVATCGFNISDYQIGLLNELKIREVILAFDKDYDPLYFESDKVDKNSEEYKEYLNFNKKIKDLANKINRKTNLQVSIIKDIYNKLGPKESPFDKGKELFEALYRGREVLAERREDILDTQLEAKLYKMEEKPFWEVNKEKIEDIDWADHGSKVARGLNQQIINTQKRKAYSYNYWNKSFLR